MSSQHIIFILNITHSWHGNSDWRPFGSRKARAQLGVCSFIACFHIKYRLFLYITLSLAYASWLYSFHSKLDDFHLYTCQYVYKWKSSNLDGGSICEFLNCLFFFWKKKYDFKKIWKKINNYMIFLEQILQWMRIN